MLIVEVQDDDTEFKNNEDDLIDQFIIPILDTVSGLDKSGTKILIGVKEIGELTITYYNFTIDQLLSTCSVADILTTSITSSPSKNSMPYNTCDRFTCTLMMYTNNTLTVSMYST